MWNELISKLSNFGTQAGNWINKNPNQFGIALDMAGKAFDPTNPLAGLGTSMGQANILAEKQKADKQDQMQLLSQLVQALGGVTPKGSPGVSTVTHMVGPEGGKMTIDYDGLRRPEGTVPNMPETASQPNPW